MEALVDERRAEWNKSCSRESTIIVQQLSDEMGVYESLPRKLYYRL